MDNTVALLGATAALVTALASLVTALAALVWSVRQQRQIDCVQSDVNGWHSHHQYPAPKPPE